MKTHVRTGLAAGLIAMTTAAGAADLPRKGAPIVVPSLPPVVETWYLRGDIGYADYHRPSADFSTPAAIDVLSRERVGNAAVFGVGVGYRFSPLMRADLTLDHRMGGSFRGNAVDPLTGTAFVDQGRFESTTLLVNGYADIGTFWGVTPYVGAGLGVARNTLHGLTRASLDAATGAVVEENLGAGSDFSFAWALMAGVGVQMQPNLTLDLGYRYMNMGDMKSRNFGQGGGERVAHIGAHEARVGLRYSFR